MSENTSAAVTSFIDLFTKYGLLPGAYGPETEEHRVRRSLDSLTLRDWKQLALSLACEHREPGFHRAGRPKETARLIERRIMMRTVLEREPGLKMIDAAKRVRREIERQEISGTREPGPIATAAVISEDYTRNRKLIESEGYGEEVWAIAYFESTAKFRPLIAAMDEIAPSTTNRRMA